MTILWGRPEVAAKTQSVLEAPQPIITVEEARKLLGVASKNISDADIERFPCC